MRFSTSLLKAPKLRAAVAALAAPCAVLACAAAPAQAGLIDFEAFADGTVPGGSLTIISDGIPVTFSATGLTIFDIGSPFNTKTLRSGDFVSPITVTFGGNTVLFAEVENRINGRFTPEVDFIRGEAFDASSALLDSEQSSATILRLDGPNIATVVYGNGGTSTGYVIDNFNFAAAAAAPEPGSLALLAGSLLPLAGAVTRRSRNGKRT